MRATDRAALQEPAPKKGAEDIRAGECIACRTVVHTGGGETTRTT